MLPLSRKSIEISLHQLPKISSDDVVGIVGIGASEYAARSAAFYYRSLGIRAFSIASSELMMTQSDEADFYLVVSESGRSSETLRAVAHLDKSKCALITNLPESPLGKEIPTILPLGCGEDSAVYTIGYTATLQALGLIGEYWSGSSSDWSGMGDQVARIITGFGPIAESLITIFDPLAVIDVVGAGLSIASAGEGALILREAARLRTTFHETFNYLHGPMEPLESNMGAIIVGSGRELELAKYVSELKCPVLLLTQEKFTAPHLIAFQLPRMANPLSTPIFEIVAIQLIAYSFAKNRSLKVDGFRYKQSDIKIV